MISHCSSTFFLNLNFLILVYPGTTGKTLISVHSWIARDNRKCAVLRPCSLISPFIVEHAVLPSGNLVGTAILFCSARPHAQPLCYLTRGCLLLKEWKIQKDPSAIHATQDRVQTHAWVAPEHWNGAWRGTLLFPGLRFSKASSGVQIHRTSWKTWSRALQSPCCTAVVRLQTYYLLSSGFPWLTFLLSLPFNEMLIQFLFSSLFS